MKSTEAQPRRVRPRPVFRTVAVRRVSRVTPSMTRITLAGAELEGFALGGPAGHIRMYFPSPGRDLPVVPEWGPNGPVRTEGQERPVARVYTPRRWDSDAGELDVDIALHRDGEGPGMSWARRAKPGDMVVITGPAGAYRVDPDVDRYVVASDHAGLPALCTVLESLAPTARAQVYVEVESKAEEQPLESHAELDVTWLHSDAADAVPGRVLEAALGAAKLPDGGGRVFVACEASIMRGIRRHLLEDRGFDRGAIYTHGYWKAGAANHPDHDLGHEI
jgi:NADPH-dependent ferric siderophore reductase